MNFIIRNKKRGKCVCEKIKFHLSDFRFLKGIKNYFQIFVLPFVIAYKIWPIINLLIKSMKIYLHINFFILKLQQMKYIEMKLF